MHFWYCYQPPRLFSIFSLGVCVGVFYPLSECRFATAYLAADVFGPFLKIFFFFFCFFAAGGGLPEVTMPPSPAAPPSQVRRRPAGGHVFLVVVAFLAL